MKQNCRGFSLIQLLVVIAIIAIMATVTVPAVGTASRRAKFSKALSAVAAEMELAQQSAVAASTYAWVAFSAGTNQPLLVSARSLEGRSPTNPVVDLTATNAIAIQIGRVQSLEGIVFSETLPNTSTYTNLPAGQAAASTPMQSALGLKARVPGTSEVRSFDWAVEFNPMGEATVRTASGAFPVENVKLVAIPSAGATPGASEQQQAALIWINGLTGGVEVLQP